MIGFVLGQGARLAGAGVSAGLLGSLLVSRLLAPIAPVNYSPELWVWLAGPVVVSAAVGVAGILPARRASMADPLILLRNDH